MTKPANNTTPAKGKPAAAKKDAAANPATKAPEQVEAEKAAITKAKAEQKAKDDAAKAEAKAAKEKEAAEKKAAKEAEAKAKADAKAKEAAEKEATAAAKKAEKEAAEAAKAEANKAAQAAREEALAKIADAEKAVEAAQDTLEQAKADLKALRIAAKVPSGNGGSTDALRQRASTYVKDSEHKTAAGNASVHCNDAVAQKMLGKTLDECYAIAAGVLAPDVTEADLRAKYAHLNPGMQRMNLGNKMRGILNAK